MDERAESMQRKSQRAARVAAAVVVLLGAMGLMGWLLGEPWLVNWTAWSGFEMPNSAAALMACGGSLWLQARARAPVAARVTGVVLACIAGAIGLGTIVEYARGVDLGIDRLLIDAGPATPYDPYPGRVGEGASLALTLASISLVVLRTRSLPALGLSTVCTVMTLMIALTAALGYAFDVSDDSPFWSLLNMALQTALALLVLGLGMIMSRPDRPLLATLLSPYAGGVIARRVLAAAIGLPILLSLVHFAGVHWVGASAAMATELAIVIVGVTIVVLITAAALNTSDRRRRLSEETQTRMMHELDHRVKNSLATVLAVCDQTADTSDGLERFRETFRGRIQAMARAHEALAATRWHGVELGPMIRATVEPFVGPGSDRLRLSGGRVMLKAEAALPVAATLHELATNAVKHGGLSGRPDAGQVEVKWGVTDGGRLTIDWVETGSGGANGAGPTTPGAPQGFGTTLIRGLIAHELKGSTDLDLAPGIVTCRLTVPPASLLRTAHPAS